MKIVGKTSGFTVIEVAIVCTVIAILATITTVGYLGYQKQTASQKISSVAARVIAGAEKFYTDNNEYPGGGQLSLGFASRETRAASLGIPADELEQDGASFLFCDNSGSRNTNGIAVPCNNPNTVYYVIDWWNTEDVVYAATPNQLAGPCTLSFPAGAEHAGFSTFVVWYLDPQTNKWVYKKSSRGQVAISGTGCAFSAN